MTLHYTLWKKTLKHFRTNGTVDEVWATQQLVGVLVFAKIGVQTKCGEKVQQLVDTIIFGIMYTCTIEYS